jgi:phosphoribosylformylglycinamidine cyclo-ligase
MMKTPLTYRSAGVDIAEGDRFADFIRALAKSTHGPQVVDAGDAYAGLYRLPAGADPQPVIAATCDGVGTKLLVARDCQDYRGIGQDLVAMNVNDLLPRGARPLLFLDYIAAGSLSSVPLAEIATSIAAACKQTGCALLGGETAELPDAYREGDCDLAGFAVGIVEQSIAPRGDICAGDLIVGLPSSGIHANGLSLARKVIAQAGLAYTDTLPTLERSIGQELLVPTALYVEAVMKLLEAAPIKAAAHITGGGLLRRAHKLCPPDLQLHIDPSTYPRPAIFSALAQLGSIPEQELAQTFNMGIGFLLIASPQAVDALRKVPSVPLLVVGSVRSGTRAVDLGYAQLE